MSGRTTLLRLRDVQARCGIGKSTIYLLMSQNRFPEPVRLSVRAVRWKETDIDQWIETACANPSDRLSEREAV